MGKTVCFVKYRPRLSSFLTGYDSYTMFMLGKVSTAPVCKKKIGSLLSNFTKKKIHKYDNF